MDILWVGIDSLMDGTFINFVFSIYPFLPVAFILATQFVWYLMTREGMQTFLIGVIEVLVWNYITHGYLAQYFIDSSYLAFLYVMFNAFVLLDYFDIWKYR